MTEKQQEALREYDEDDRVLSSLELHLKLSKEARKGVHVLSLIPSLDRATEGFQEGELVVISGPTKNGKTLLAQSLTMNFVFQQYYPLWFSYEVPAKQFLSQFPDLPNFYMPAKLKAHALTWLEERAMESFLKFHTRIIFIDHLHFVFDMAKTRNPSIEIGTIIRRLKTFAVNNGFIIFLLAHTRKGKADKNFSFEDIRDSSFVAQESDTVFLIGRTPDRGENSSQMKIEFHRRTGCLERVIDLIKIDGFLKEQTN